MGTCVRCGGGETLILIDASAWIEFFRGTGSKYQSAVHDLVADGADFGLADVTILELLQGIKNDAAFDQVKHDLSYLPVYASAGVRSYVHAADIFRACAKRRRRVTTIDCLIAAIAIENNLALLHKDADFDQIAEVTGQLKLYKV